jgi:hypothetical protein
MEFDSIHDNLKDLLDKTGGKFNIFEEQIDVDMQVEFFEQANKDLEEKIELGDLENVTKELFRKDVSVDLKKKLLVQLSNSKEVEHYRLIEKFIKTSKFDLRSWSILALQHARISLESDLLDEQQVFISTGLGGKGENLRYFFVGKLKGSKTFSSSQIQIIKNEFDIQFKKNNSIIEKIDFFNNFFTIITLIPISLPISDVIVESISQANNFGSFLHDQYLVTNVKILDVDEIDMYFKKKGI